jgi:hypothetical protein
MAWANIIAEIILTALLVLVLGGGSILLAVWLGRALKVKADREHTLKLKNRGNCRSQYQLSIKDTRPELTFTVLSNNVPLATVVEDVEKEEFEVTPEYVAESATAQPVVSKKTEKLKDAVKPGDALKTGQSVAAKSGILASLLGTLGSILPGKLGASLKAQAGTARNVQANTAKAVQAPQAVQRKADALGQASGKLGVKTPEKAGQSQSGNNIPQSNFEQGSPSALTQQQQHVGVVRQSIKQLQERYMYVQTAALDPGKSMQLTLRIGTNQKRYPSGSLNYTIQSQQVPLDTSLGSADPVEQNGVVHFEPIGEWRYWLPATSSSLVILGALFGIFYGLSLIWG